MSNYRKQVSLGFSPEGKRIRKWVYADTERELNRKVNELLKKAEHELWSAETFGKYAQEWFTAYKSHRSAATKEMYAYTLQCLSPLDLKPLKEITRMDVQRIITDYADRPASARQILMTAKQILDSAAADGLIAPKVLKIELPKPKHREKRALTKAEKEAIRKADLTPMERLFVDIEYYLGLRPEETRALGPKDFDFKARTVTISKAVAVSGGQAILKDTKTGVTRTLPVPDVLLASVKAYKTRFSFFVDEEGNYMNKWKYDHFTRQIFRKINAALGGTRQLDLLNGMTMYTFRHNRATDLYYLQGVSLKKKAEYMGHSETMFLKTYSHLDDDREETEKLRQIV